MVYDPKWDYKNDKPFGPGKSIPSNHGGMDNPWAVRAWVQGIKNFRDSNPVHRERRKRLVQAYRKHAATGVYNQPKNRTAGE